MTGKLPGQLHVGFGRLDVLQPHILFDAGFDLALMLMQQSDSLDQRQKLHVVAACARHGVREAPLFQALDNHIDRAQQPLRVAVQAHDLVPPRPRFQAFERLRLALLLVDGLGLFAVLIHRQHKATIHQFLVHLVRSGRKEQHHRPLHRVLVRNQLAAHWVFAGAGDIQLALRLQEFERIARGLRALLLGDGQYLVFEILLPHVEESLAGHRRVLLSMLLRYEVENRFHQRTFARRRGRLHHDGQRLRQQARHRGQITHLLVGLLAHCAATLEVFQHTVKQARIAQQVERGRLLLGRYRLRFLLRCERLRNTLPLQVAEHGPQFAHVGVHRLFLHRELVRRLLDERRPPLEALHVERVAVIAVLPAHVLARHLHVDLHPAPRCRFLQPQHAVLARPDAHAHFLAVCFDLRLGGHRERHGPRWRLFARHRIYS